MEWPAKDDVEEDSVIHVSCKRQNSNLLSERCKEETFLKTGYKNWKKATERFDKHQQSKCHRSAVTYEAIVPQCRKALEMIDENKKKWKELNRRIFLTILETFQYLARHGLAVRGYDDDESNFIQLLRLQSKKFPELTACSQLHFSVMCDEYTDVSNKEQLTFCMRWVNNDLEISEKFLGFYEIPDIKSSIIVTVMKDILLRYQLNLDVCRGQCYDGASKMLGKSFGVARFLQNIQRHIAHTAMLILYRFQSKMLLKILRFYETTWVPQRRKQF